ncbi:MAG: hypothetical protein ACYSWP_25345 [Planctomycetota bacterium]|jgi:hypothetical protein
MWLKLSAIFGILMGLYWILFRRRYSKRALNKVNDESKKESDTGLFKRLKKMRLEGILANFIEFQVTYFGICLILMYIPTFFPQLRHVVNIILKFLFFSYFSVCFAALIMMTLLRRFLFKDTDRYTLKRDALKIFTQKGRIGNFYEKPASDDESGQDADPTLRALNKKLAIKATICFILLYTTFLFLFFKIVK